MRRLLALAVPVVLLILAPASAGAKGILSARVCGADGCRAVPPSEGGVLAGGAETSPPPRREPFVRIDVRVGVPGHIQGVRLLFLPGSELLLSSDGATWLVPMALSELRAIAARVEPFPARRLPASAPVGHLGGSGPPAATGLPAAPPRSAAGDLPASPPRSATADLPASPPRSAAAHLPAAPARSGGAWWLAFPGAAIVLAAGAALARRRRDGGPPRAARATG